LAQNALETVEAWGIGRDMDLSQWRAQKEIPEVCALLGSIMRGMSCSSEESGEAPSESFAFSLDAPDRGGNRDPTLDAAAMPTLAHLRGHTSFKDAIGMRVAPEALQARSVLDPSYSLDPERRRRAEAALEPPAQRASGTYADFAASLLPRFAHVVERGANPGARHPLENSVLSPIRARTAVYTGRSPPRHIPAYDYGS